MCGMIHTQYMTKTIEQQIKELKRDRQLACARTKLLIQRMLWTLELEKHTQELKGV